MNNLFNTIKESLEVTDKKVNFLVEFIEGIIQAKTVNLNEISKVMKLNIKKAPYIEKYKGFY